MSANFILLLDLQLFAEEEATADSGLATAETGETEQTPTAQTETVDLDSEFDALIKGKYKEQYGKRIKDNLSTRLKGAKENEAKLKAYAPMLEMLGKKYGVDHNDAKLLTQALEDDNAYYEDEALARNMTVESVKALHKIERENKELRAAEDERQKAEEDRQRFGEWIKQGEEVKKTYPSFNLEAEIADPEFCALLDYGFSVESAYKARHIDDIMTAAMTHTAQTVEQKVVNNIAANGARPSENGLSDTSGATLKTDVSKFSKQQMEDTIQRVMRGDKVYLDR